MFPLLSSYHHNISFFCSSDTCTPLTVELVPSSNWEKNVRSERKESWDKYRKESYRKANHACEICEEKNEKLECHEIWSYDIENKIQKLERLICLCHKCHRTKHWGLALISGEGDIIKKHIKKINKWKDEDVLKYIDEAFQIFDVRSSIAWELDLSVLDKTP